MHSLHILPALLALLLSAAVAAQEVNIPDREQRRGMSYEEYSSVRENMRLRMEKMREAERKQEALRDEGQNAANADRKPDSAYGQGYHTRTTRPDTATMERPERPERGERPARIERFNRSDMMRR